MNNDYREKIEKSFDIKDLIELGIESDDIATRRIALEKVKMQYDKVKGAKFMRLYKTLDESSEQLKGELERLSMASKERERELMILRDREFRLKVIAFSSFVLFIAIRLLF